MPGLAEMPRFYTHSLVFYLFVTASLLLGDVVNDKLSEGEFFTLSGLAMGLDYPIEAYGDTSEAILEGIP